MKILFLTYYFEPDLCAGSFRNTSLFKELSAKLTKSDTIDVITTKPNRYNSYKVDAESLEKRADNIIINRVRIPAHNNGLISQVKSFKVFYDEAIKIVKNNNYDLVYASSSRLFTAFLGAKIARKKGAKLYLDIRDLFRETITDLYKNKILKFGLNLILKPIENYTFGYASHINLVSKGFKSYFNKFNTEYSFYTNGIDDLFLSLKNNIDKRDNTSIKTVVYGGNIGEGQGLDLIIPQIAEKLSDNFKFLIIGDGGAKHKLIKEIKDREITNVELIPPVKRDELIMYYQNADYLFLHLNKHKAFERVLPSKLFEYGTFDTPIIAGVGGYAQVFLEKNMPNLILFEPTNYNQLFNKLSDYSYKRMDRTEFKNEFSRKEINKLIAKSIIKICNE